MMTKVEYVAHHLADQRTLSRCGTDDVPLVRKQMKDSRPLKVKVARKSKKCIGKNRKGYPKRPLSAYNIFFHHEQQRMLNEPPNEDKSAQLCGLSHGNMGIARLARMVAARWKALLPEDKMYYIEEAQKDQTRYSGEMSLWHQEQRIRQLEADAIKPQLPQHQIHSNGMQDPKCILPIAIQIRHYVDHLTSNDHHGKSLYEAGVAKSASSPAQATSLILRSGNDQVKTPATAAPQLSPNCTVEDWSDVRLFPTDGRTPHFEQPNSFFDQLSSELDDDEKEILCSLFQT